MSTDECIETRNGQHGKMSIKICTLVGECDCRSDTCCFDGGWKASSDAFIQERME